MSTGGFSRLVVRGSFLLTLFSGAPVLHGQSLGLPLTIRASYTTSAKMYLNPRSASFSVRNELMTVEDLTGIGAELQLPLTEDGVAAFLSVEYLSVVEEGDKPVALDGTLRILPVRDGFFLVPVEVGGLAAIPMQAETIRLTMSAGVGAYFAGRILQIVDVEATTASLPVGYGIVVSIGFDYRLSPGIWLHADTRFRDPEVTMDWTYDRRSTVYKGSTLNFPTSTMHTKVNVDGFSIAGGVLVDLSEIF